MRLHSPLSSRLARRALGDIPIEAACTRSVELSPTIHVPKPPKPLYLDHELDRVIGSDIPMSHQMAWLDGTTEFGGATAFQLPAMWMVDGNLARGRFRYPMSAQRERLLPSAHGLERLREVALSSSVSGNLSFGHHILDNLSTAVVAADFGPPRFVNPPSSLSDHLLDYRRLTELEHPTTWSAHTSGCWVFRDVFLNDAKVARINQLRDRVRPKLSPAGARRVFLHRGNHGVLRAPRNEAVVEGALADDGWLVLDPMIMDLQDVLNGLAGADIVAGVEGSQLSHLFYAVPTGSTVLVLMPPRRFTLVLKDFCDRLDLRYSFHVGIQDDDHWDVDLAGVRRLVDKADSMGRH